MLRALLVGLLLRPRGEAAVSGSEYEGPTFMVVNDRGGRLQSDLIKARRAVLSRDQRIIGLVAENRRLVAELAQHQGCVRPCTHVE